MPANLTPDYFKAEQWYRSASTNEEKMLALEQMLAVMPKHKGTEHLQADLKRKLSQLKDASAQQKKAGKHVDIFHVPRSGAGQVVLLGTPNSGKSAILAALTHAKVTVAEFPFATHAPVPGMVRYEDVQIQLVDMPPITADYAAPGQVGTYRNGDLIDYRNHRTSFMFNLGAGGGALLLRKGWPHNQLLGAHLMSDGTMSEHVIVPASGTRQFPTDAARALNNSALPDSPVIAELAGAARRDLIADPVSYTHLTLPTTHAV